MSINPIFIDTAKKAFLIMRGWTEPTITSNEKSLHLTSHREKHRVSISFTPDSASAIHDYLSAPFESRSPFAQVGRNTFTIHLN
jgi:hypothetical protein